MLRLLPILVILSSSRFTELLLLSSSRFTQLVLLSSSSFTQQLLLPPAPGLLSCCCFLQHQVYTAAASSISRFSQLLLLPPASMTGQAAELLQLLVSQ
jgi:hypothetical protein